MPQIKYVKGDATRPQGPGIKIIPHVCNNAGGWGSGFVLAISKRWPEPEKVFRSFGKKLLGKTAVVRVEYDIYVANMVAQNNFKSDTNPIPLSYGHLFTTLLTVYKFAQDKGATVHMPRIGCGLARGSWNKVEALIKMAMDEYPVDTIVYDFN